MKGKVKDTLKKILSLFLLQDTEISTECNHVSTQKALPLIIIIIRILLYSTVLFYCTHLLHSFTLLLW